MHIEAASLCGVMITAAVTYVFAIPANSYHWQMEIWNRGGGTWTFDKNGRWDWKWMVEPISDTPPAKRVVAPSSQTKVRTSGCRSGEVSGKDGGKSRENVFTAFVSTK